MPRAYSPRQTTAWRARKAMTACGFDGLPFIILPSKKGSGPRIWFRGPDIERYIAPLRDLEKCMLEEEDGQSLHPED